MSELFHAEQAKRTKGAFSVTMKNGRKLALRLKKLEDGGERAIKRTVSDFASRAPGWVSKGIRQHYGVDTAAIKEAGPRTKRGATSIRVTGVSVDGASLKYEGKTLTPIHFNMNYHEPHPKGLEKKWGAIPGQKVARKKSPHTKKAGQDVVMARQPKPYKLKATIIKGHRATMEAGTYLAPAKKGSSGPILPFQKTPDGKFPVEAIHTLSVPQMIGNEEHLSRASDTISKLISENLEKRFEHHVQQAMK